MPTVTGRPPAHGRGRVPAVGAVLIDSRGRLLLIRRGHAPGAGRWSVPGGHVEPGEARRDAVRREVAEETGLDVAVLRRLGRVRVPTGDGRLFVVDDYRCRVRGGTLTAGDDAAEARWVSPGDVRRLPLVAGLAEALTRWGVLRPAGRRGRRVAWLRRAPRRRGTTASRRRSRTPSWAP